MSAVPNPPSIAEHEQSCLAELAADEAHIRFKLESFATKPDHSAEEINALVDDLNGCRQRLQLYQPRAGYLYNMGRPWAWQQLTRVIADLQQAIGIFKEMYQSKLEYLTTVYHIQQQAQQDWLNTLQQTVRTNQAAANTQYKQWNGLFTRSCATCGYSLGDLYFKLEICPSCGMLLRR